MDLSLILRGRKEAEIDGQSEREMEGGGSEGETEGPNKNGDGKSIMVYLKIITKQDMVAMVLKFDQLNKEKLNKMKFDK